MPLRWGVSVEQCGSHRLFFSVDSATLTAASAGSGVLKTIFRNELPVLVAYDL